MKAALEGAALSDDLLKGLGDLAIFYYRKNTPTNRRKVMYQIEQNRLPIFRLGRSIFARKSVLMAHIKEQERANLGPQQSQPKTALRRGCRR